VSTSIQHRFKIKRLHSAGIVADDTTLRLYFGDDIIRVFAFDVKTSRAMADFTTGILQLGGFINRYESAGTTVAGGVTTVAFFYFRGGQAFLHFFDAFIGFGFFGIGFEIVIFDFVAVFTGLGAGICGFILIRSNTNIPKTAKNQKKKENACRQVIENVFIFRSIDL